MLVRKSLGAVLATSLAASVVALTAGPASAVYAPQPEDSKAAPVAADLIGVGSDTTMLSMKAVADIWNADATKTFDIATFGAFGGGTLPLPSGDTQNRPNGSSNGKAALLNPSYADVDFARSSDALKSDGTEDALRAFPFALDTVVMAVSGSVASNAPTALTKQNVIDIYKCLPSADNWSDFGGANVAIKPYVPQSGSGTEKFFKAQIGGTYGNCVKDYADVNNNGTYDAGTDTQVQEHTDTLIKNDPAAIVPISKGRAGLIPGGTLRLFAAGDIPMKRAVYNVVRATDSSDADVLAVFSSTGFLCSPAARDAIAAGGLTQLATPANGGACGQPVASTTNFVTNDTIVTTTTLRATQTTAGGVSLVATVSGSSTPSGTVSFFEGASTLRAGQPMLGGVSTFVVPAAALGAHTYRAVYTPSGDPFAGSEGIVSITVVAPPAPVVPAVPADTRPKGRLKETFPAVVKKGKKATGTVKVVAPKKLTGTVKIMEGGKVLKTVKLKKGVSKKVTLPKLKKGKHTLTVVWAGNAKYGQSVLTFRINQK